MSGGGGVEGGSNFNYIPNTQMSNFVVRVMFVNNQQTFFEDLNNILQLKCQNVIRNVVGRLLFNIRSLTIIYVLNLGNNFFFHYSAVVVFDNFEPQRN